MAKQWTTLSSIRQKMLSSFASGKFFVPNEKELLPYSVKIAGPDSAQILDDFKQARDWTLQFKDCKDFYIEYKKINHRVYGTQQLPIAVVFSTMSGIFRFIRKESELNDYLFLKEKTLNKFPQLVKYLSGRSVFEALTYKNDWELILKLLSFVQKGQHKNLFFRQISFVDTKFVESHLGVLSHLFDIVLSSENINTAYQRSPKKQFALRYGFRYQEERVRIRLLDGQIKPFKQDICLCDLTLDYPSFKRLSLECANILICENEVSFLALPQISNTIAIFGSGFGFSAFKDVPWFKDKNIFYWGDLDTNGFAILNELRQTLSGFKITSLLMDMKTLLNNKDRWVMEGKQFKGSLPALTRQELEVYEVLSSNSLAQNIRLEQELIPYEDVLKALLVINDM